MSSAAKVFRALSDATRIRLLNLLIDRPCCVCELCDALRISQPNASRHLLYLKRYGLVTDHSEGKWKVYSISPAPSELISGLLRCVRSVRNGSDELARDLANLQTAFDKSPRRDGRATPIREAKTAGAR